MLTDHEVIDAGKGNCAKPLVAPLLSLPRSSSQKASR